MSKTRRTKKRLARSLSIVLVIVILAYIGFTLLRPLPDIKPTLLPLDIKTASNLAWPSQGESAVGIVGTNVLDTYGEQVPKPTASTGKLITALVVLKDKPLSLNEQGPTITMTQSDVDIYNRYVAEDGSVVKVEAGEELSEYQMLQAMMLPSANNIADSLAIWAYGSLSAYSEVANTYIKSLGLTGTTVGSDASGYNPSTVSTAHDLVSIGELVMQNPVLASIVSQTNADLPVAGNVKNVNNLLGMDNIVGIKTGNTDQAGGVFVGAVKFSLGDQSKVIVTANVGANSLSSALGGSVGLLRTVQSNFHDTTLLTNGMNVATYKAPWSKTVVSAKVNSDITADVWGGDSFKLGLTGLKPVKSTAAAGSEAGNVSDQSLSSSTALVSLNADIPSPSIFWRITHP